MSNDKKFGTFPGVFTPSILTILGVIMYLRLGWVVGQAGLIGTIGIIIVAHIISITTGLSISAIATDKKIKAGGIYYILSRSLGLPMGGAIGIALFTGTALSISMYVVGFAESFLNIPVVSDLLQLQPGVQAYRIVGTVTIIILVILAFISTSLAIKSQYFILGAIALSLVSIIVGFITNSQMVPTSPALFTTPTSLSLEKVFAVFFPAATGFTAGVAMSGDLKDPKKNIPKGTLIAITVGFVVYLSLAICFALFVDRKFLLTDTNIAMNIAWIPGLVVAGIWGATLSSALGGILGGPRILQALSKDKVTPKIFAKGYGQANEPRNALILIFIIAEAGIMIGNLNVIAGVVTMFYLASYGFINLAYILENWASTDFRPSFKVSSIFGVIGFIFAFAMMFQLDVVSMLVSFVIIGAIYFILQRKQLKLDFGDVWQSVWISVIRRGLHVLDNNDIEDRNWQPNIILFSGANKKRSYLVEFGQSLVGKFGFLSNFDLTVDTTTDVLFPKYKQSIPNKDNRDITFFRQQSCKDIYEGIEMIVRTYGFSGIEPNTVIMGWGRQSKNPERFVKLMQTINDLDYNILLVDYDKRFGYGKYNKIDIWWRGAGNNGNFALTLAKFMTASDNWENATIRLMIVNTEDSKAFFIYRQANEILENLRISAEVKIINNELEQTPFYDIIRTESKDADIVFIGVPSIQSGAEKEFVEKTNILLHKIGTVVLLRASSIFKELNLGINLLQQSVISASDNIDLVEEINNQLIESKQPELNKIIHQNFDGIIEIYNKTLVTYTFKEIDFLLEILKNYNIFTKNIFELLSENKQKLNQHDFFDYIERYQRSALKKANKELEDFIKKRLNDLNETMTNVLAEYNLQTKKYLHSIDDDINLYFNKDELKFTPEDNWRFKVFKLRHSIFSKKNNTISIKFSHKDRNNSIIPKLQEILSRQIEQVRIETMRFLYFFNSTVLKLVTSLNKPKKTDDIDDFDEALRKAKHDFNNNYINLETQTKNIVLKVAENRKKTLLKTLNTFLSNSNHVNTFFYDTRENIKYKEFKKQAKLVNTKKDIFFSSFKLYIKHIQLMTSIKEINIFINHINEKLIINLEKQGDKPETNIKTINTAINKIFDNIKTVQKNTSIMEKSILNDSFYKNFNKIKTIDIPLQQIFRTIINNELNSKLKNAVRVYSTEKNYLNLITSVKEIAKNQNLIKFHNVIELSNKKKKQ